MDDQSAVYLGCDTGEEDTGPGRIREMALLPHVTAVSIACGGHAGDHDSMREAIAAALEHGCVIGAHPSYPDRSGFGRRAMKIERGLLESSLLDQLNAFSEIADASEASVFFVKAHGALYHAISRDVALAHWYWACCESVFPAARFVGPFGSTALAELRASGVPVLVEGFCDRVYESDGVLRPRNVAGACISDPERAAAQAERIIRESGCDLLCVHSDTHNAIAVAQAVNERIHELGMHPDRRS